MLMKDKEHLIGQGGFHQVFKATRKHDSYACCIRVGVDMMDTIAFRERFGYIESVRVQKGLNHPLIVGVIDDFIDSDSH